MNADRVDYSPLDRPEVLAYVFHPRPEWGSDPASDSTQEVMIPVEETVSIGARLHLTDIAAPNILFFHGNGEIVSDYDDLGSVYNRMGINFLPVDYRGYGRSSGTPTVSAMMQDCHQIFRYLGQWLKKNGYTGSLVVMGRSLGSASALELAAHYTDQIPGLIIESGFAYAVPLLRLLGVDSDRLGFREEHGFRNIEKIKRVTTPTLIIHAAFDHIIPFSDGKALYDNCASSDKTLLEISNANHNDILLQGLSDYLAAVKSLAQKVK